MSLGRSVRKYIEDEDNQFCMVCGGEYTEELPCTCLPEESEDRYILRGVLARLTAAPVGQTDTERDVLEYVSDLGDAVDMAYDYQAHARSMDTIVRELIATITAYLKEDNDQN